MKQPTFARQCNASYFFSTFLMKFQAKHWFDTLLAWRRQNFSEAAFILIISGIVGLLSGLAALFLKTAVHLLEDRLTVEKFSDNYFQLLYPMLGLLVTILLAKWVYKESQEHAISDIIFSIQNRFSKLHYSKMYSHLLTSIFTVGFGGSVGLESPIVYSGATIGSNIAKLLYFKYDMRTLMMGCGTAGVISAIFNAPIAGLIFSIEIILSKVSVSNFIPLLVSSVIASLMAYFVQGSEILFFFPTQEPFIASQFYLFILLGIVCGLTSLLFRRILERTEHIMKKISNIYQRVILGGSLLSIVIFLFPPTYGEGYISIKQIINGQQDTLFDRGILLQNISLEPTALTWLYLILYALLVVAKMFASAITISSGGSGGTFAPSFFIGSFTGFCFARFLNMTELAEVSELNFILVGMSGVLCGMQYAPLTAIFLIAEITGGYTLFVPLMMVSAITFTTVSWVQPNSMYLQPLIQKGFFIKDEADNRILSKLNFNNIIEKDLKVIREDQTLRDLVKLVTQSKRNIFPVVNENYKFKGIVTLDMIREVMFDQDKYDSIRIANIAEFPPATVEYGEKMTSVMSKFEMHKLWNLPVVQDGKYLGFLSKSRIFSLYRGKLISYSQRI